MLKKFLRLKDKPRQSKPGPKFALVAGTEKVNATSPIYKAGGRKTESKKSVKPGLYHMAIDKVGMRLQINLC